MITTTYEETSSVGINTPDSSGVGELLVDPPPGQILVIDICESGSDLFDLAVSVLHHDRFRRWITP
ncbi:MAG TPA: hypothetical protein VMH80_03390 [Bryobacteraceae bacterium]|nr:hypothetical protein [Bryobacteraceae bacterium]